VDDRCEKALAIVWCVMSDGGSKKMDLWKVLLERSYFNLAFLYSLCFCGVILLMQNRDR